LLAFWAVLLVAYAGRKIRLVCATGRFHPPTAVPQFLAAPPEEGEVYGLPPYCPSLHLIERLGGHRQRTVLAHVLDTSIQDLVAAFRKGARRGTGTRERMKLMCTHEEPQQSLPPQEQQVAA
jgi:hypothetical protein